jgi:hypothetical protein
VMVLVMIIVRRKMGPSLVEFSVLVAVQLVCTYA